jgi:putative hydrolase of HD superfamily
MKENNEIDLLKIMSFINECEKLKNTMRQCWTTEGKQESTAEHSWRLCMMVMLLSSQFEGINTLKLMKMCLIHDLAEIIDGDIPAIIKVPNKSEKERKNLIILTENLPLELKNEILNLWDDYENVLSLEAKIAKGLDKLETLMQHQVGINPLNFNYNFNLNYGKEYTNLHPVLKFIREIVDEKTIEKIELNKKVA